MLHPPLDKQEEKDCKMTPCYNPPDPPLKFCVQCWKISSTREGVRNFFHLPGGCENATSITRRLERAHQTLRWGDRGMARCSFRLPFMTVLVAHWECNISPTHRLYAPE